MGNFTSELFQSRTKRAIPSPGFRFLVRVDFVVNRKFDAETKIEMAALPPRINYLFFFPFFDFTAFFLAAIISPVGHSHHVFI